MVETSNGDWQGNYIFTVNLPPFPPLPTHNTKTQLF